MDHPPLKIFTDRACIPEGIKHCLMLIPFWGNYLDHDGYARFEREGKDFLRLTPAEDADVALLPFDGTHIIDQHKYPNPKAVELAAGFVRRARAAGLKTVILLNNDSQEKIRLSDVIVFRTSLNRQTRAQNEFALPAWHEDLVTNQCGGQVPYRERPDVPSVGFCGHVGSSKPPLRRRVKLMLRAMLRQVGVYLDHRDGIYIRREAMDALSRYPNVRTDFIPRSQYFGGAGNDPVVMAQVRREYVHNLVNNDYTLCVRGYGNFSFRFFEAMSIGRVPLLIDTECVLPYDFLHDYRDYCIVVPEKRLRFSGEAVADFHGGFTSEGYLDLQRRVREFWVRWLSPEGFFRNLSLHWRTLAADPCLDQRQTVQAATLRSLSVIDAAS